MGDTYNYNSEDLLHDLGGCGRFQILVATLTHLSAIPMLFSRHMVPFNIFNPGWKCVGNATTNSIITSKPENWTEFGMHSCEAYEACPQAEFSPDASTVVSEFGLICNKGWIISTILAMEGLGNLCSTLIVGYMGDHFGRKIPYIVSRIAFVSLSLGLIFCKTWEYYAAVTFLMGFVGAYGLLSLTIATEYASPDWRLKLYSMPVWTTVGLFLALVCRFFPDWKTLNLVVVVSGAITLLPLFVYLPESLRWVSVKGKKENLLKLISKIADVNKTQRPSDAKIQSMIEKNELEEKKPTYTAVALFRKGYRVPTLVLGFINFSIQLIYFAFNFGIGALPGNFYNNLLIFVVTDFPANILAFFFANKFPRKPSMMTMFGCCSLSIFGVVAIDQLGAGDVKLYGTVALVMVAKTFLYISWVILSTSQIEIYPTVVRTTVNGFSSFFTAIGGIVAPYLIPSDPRTYYINYLVMAIVAAACTCALFFVPETKGKPLKDRWDDDEVAAVEIPDVLSLDFNAKKTANTNEKHAI